MPNIKDLIARAPEIALNIMCVVPGSATDERAFLQALRDGRLVVTEGWQDISTAPRDGSVFWAINMRGTVRADLGFKCYSSPCQDGQTWADDAGWVEVGDDWPAYPTHWAPLLPAPAKESKP